MQLFFAHPTMLCVARSFPKGNKGAECCVLSRPPQRGRTCCVLFGTCCVLCVNTAHAPESTGRRHKAQA